MIQLITGNYSKLNNKFKENSEIKVTTFSEYQSFDMYDINVIDLNCESFWKCDSSKITSLNIKHDLIPLKKTIDSCHTKVVIQLPLNYTFKYNKSSYTNTFQSFQELKSITSIIIELLRSYIYNNILDITFEKCETKIDNSIYYSDFYFEEINEENILLRSNKGKKPNTYIDGNVVVTTIDVFESNDKVDMVDNFNSFINAIYKDNEEKVPDWINEILFFDDKNYIDKINDDKAKILVLENDIRKNRKRLKHNKKVKSILYTTGNELRNEVVNILEDILNEHNDFKDVFEEDYKFISDDTTFIVETKGVNNEVSGQNVTDAFSHMTIYEDNLEKQNKVEMTKCLFIVANERNKEVKKRKRINPRQETIAKRNNTLIIDTPTLLNIYEDFLKKKISKEEIIKIFKEQFGVIVYTKMDGDKND